ncbi:Synaptic vesicle transporter SVOP, partial [Exophiala xenobiotica]
PQNEGLFTSEPLEVPVFASAPSTNAKEVATEEPHVCGYELRDITNADGEVKLYKMVVFGPADPENPRNFSKTRKWVITMTLSWVCFAVAFSSAVITPGILGVAEHFHTSEEVALLTITLFVVGFGIGPLVFGPLSELYGRWIVYVATFGVAIIFMVPCAVAKNIQTLLVCRAIDGIAISVPVAN